MININKYILLQKNKDNNKIYNYNLSSIFIWKAVNNKALSIIKHFFEKALISKPLFINNNQNKMTIYMVYYMPISLSNKQKYKANDDKLNNINSLGNYLWHKCYKNLKLELRFIQLYYPYMDSEIFAQYIALNSMKYRFNKIWKILYKRFKLIKLYNTYNKFKSLSNIKGYATGIKMLINGRLASQRIRPRTRKFQTSIGSFKHNSSSSLIDSNIYTHKNNMGAYSIKIWISQKISSSHRHIFN